MKISDREKVVIPDERSEIRNPGPFELQMPWIPDRVRDDGKNQMPKVVLDFIYILNPKVVNPK
jgi:hypothetical protein